MIRKTASLLALFLFVLGACSHTPSYPTGEKLDPALKSLPQIPYPTALDASDPTFTAIPTVAVASGDRGRNRGTGRHCHFDVRSPRKCPHAPHQWWQRVGARICPGGDRGGSAADRRGPRKYRDSGGAVNVDRPLALRHESWAAR